MSYTVKEMFATLQGEGAQSGRASVFCRFAGCNLWSGREADRASAQCRFCDTDFIGTNGQGGARFPDAASLADSIAALWPGGPGGYVVFTGGEPLLQLDAALLDAVHARGLTAAVETNGTIAAPAGVDWLCVSPKAGTNLVQRSGAELKLVFPQPGLMPDRFDGAHGAYDFAHRFLQPMDGPDRAANTAAAVAYCLAHPRWRLSLQMHKMIGIP